MKSYLFLILVGLMVVNKSSIVNSLSLDVFSEIRDILDIGHSIVVGSVESLTLIEDYGKYDEEMHFPFLRKTEKRLLNKINNIDQRLKNMEEKIDQRATEIIDVILNELPQQEEIIKSLTDLNSYLTRVDELYEDFINYNNNDEFSNDTKLRFAEECTSPRYEALPNILKSINRLIIPKNIVKFEPSLFEQLAKSTSKEAEVQVCNEKQSPQQLLFNLYSLIVLSELKGYAMMGFSYSILRLHSNGKEDFAAERNKTTRDYQSRLQNTMRVIKVAMAYAPRDLWRCDPKNNHVKDETYTELTQVFQGYIVNEVDLNSMNTCRENCGYYSYTKVHGCYDNQYCAEQRRCNGKILNCQYIDSDMWICPSDNKNRRYEYIQYENGKMYGKPNTCSKPTRKVDSWWRWLFWHCSYCMCYCDDFNSNSDRFFSLRDITSDVASNKVITGIKMTKVNQIIHIQIQEGKLLERGSIDNGSISWKPVDNFSRTDPGVLSGRDYHTITWEKRAIDLDDLIAPEDHLLTGARFRMVGAHLNFEIRITPFNFTSGLLIKPFEKSVWLSNDNTDFNVHGKRTELVINKPDIPTRVGAFTKPDSKTNQFLNFGPTDLEKDAGQTTIPFLDIQPVETSPPFPLSGAGIFHKGRDGSGGYIALKVMTYDFTKNIRAELPPSPSLLQVNEIIFDEVK